MIPFLRKASGSILMRVLLAVVVLALALSLGISSFFVRNAAKHPVAHVGSIPIPAEDFMNDLETKKQSLNKYFGRPITDQEALGLGLVNRTLSELITKELMTQETSRIGVVASDEQLSRQMAENPAFKDTSGKFNPQLFADYLSKTHLSERKYLDSLRQALSRGMLAGTMDAQLKRIPKAFAEPMFRYLNEERDIEIITVDANKLPDAPKPDEGTLKQFYNQHVQYFQAPETRSFNMLLLNFQEISQSINVSMEDLKTLYSQNDNKVPEKRSVRLIPFNAREDAIKAKEELTSGAPFEAVYGRYTGDLPENAPKAQEVELKQIIPEVGSEIFSMKKVNDVSEPIFLGSQYLLFVLTDIKPERILSFDEQKFTLLKRYKTEMAREKMYEYTQRAEKMLSSGSKLNEIAESFNKDGITGVVVVTWNKVTQNGKSIDGQSIPGLSSFDPKVLLTAFDTPQYTYSDPQKLQTEDYVIVEVTDVKPAHQRSFEEATLQVEHYWQFEQKRKKAAEYAKAIKDGLENYENASKLAEANFAQIDVLHKVTRANLPKDPEFASAVTQVSTAKPNQVILDVSADKVQLVRVIGTYPVNLEKFRENSSPFIQNVLQPSLARDLLSSYIAALEAHFPVARNEDYFTNFFGKEDLQNAPTPQAPDF